MFNMSNAEFLLYSVHHQDPSLAASDRRESVTVTLDNWEFIIRRRHEAAVFDNKTSVSAALKTCLECAITRYRFISLASLSKLYGRITPDAHVPRCLR